MFNFESIAKNKNIKILGGENPPHYILIYKFTCYGFFFIDK